MPDELQEWLALTIVIAVAALGLWRFFSRRKAKACGACAASGCGVQKNRPADDEVRVLAKPEVTFSKRAGGG